jgi:ribonuclease HI
LVSLDVKGAFDAAWLPSILEALKDFYCPRNLYSLTKNYFSGRSGSISTNSMRIDTTVNKVWPQGSCSGPGYWNIQYNSLLNLNFAKWTRVIAFADGLLIAVKAATVVEVENFTNMEMSKIKKWSKENKLHFNDQKSKVILISRGRKERKAIDIYLNNRHLEQVDKIKFLGIIIDSKFKFNKHIKYITDRCTKLINALSKSARINWGLRHEALKTRYNGAILPQLRYTAPLWIESIKKECNRAKYVRVQRLIILRIAKAYCTISHEALCILTGLTPINIKVEEVVTLYNITTGRSNQKYQTDKAVNPRYWLHPADIVSINDTKDDGEESLWQIFTDGSKSEQGVGSGVAIFTGKVLMAQLKFKLDNRCSNNQAEQLAILKALEAIETQQDNYNEHKTVVIYMDSEITLDSIRNAKNHNHLVEEIRKRAVTLNKKNWKIEFKWVKAHVGIYGNKIADRLAKEATQNYNITYSRIPNSAIKKDTQKESI